MGLSIYVYLRDTSFQYSTGVLLFCIQMALNIMWTPLFFWKKKIGLAFVDILLLWVALLATIIVFYEKSDLAGNLLIPYIVWLTVAVYINAYIVINNPSPSTHD